jgi:endonuclease/exonuclease/phosphatase family metal-dependent hydrolase
VSIRALTWNLYHGRDFPPNPRLFTLRSRLLGHKESNATHLQVNRDLFDEFADLLAAATWDVALLQEVPPRWSDSLSRACGAEGHGVLTSRNWFGPLRSLLARRNPDLIAANEGGSNLTLVRGEIHERRELELRSGPRPERRAMAFTRATPRGAGAEICIANLHASSGRARQALAEDEVLFAAVRASQWAGSAPLIIGGDLNLRPRDTVIFNELERRHGLGSPTGPANLDHLLVRGLEVVAGQTEWPPELREVEETGLAIRLSDHAPVEATFDFPPQEPSTAEE